jgi:hypothetical protein
MTVFWKSYAPGSEGLILCGVQSIAPRERRWFRQRSSLPSFASWDRNLGILAGASFDFSPWHL